MSEQTAIRSFVLRVYRFDLHERGKVTGAISAIDGSATSTPFTDTAQLGEALVALLAAERREPAPGGGKEDRP